LETVEARLETSKAMASLEGHSSITSRKVRKSAIPSLLGQSVLKRKDILALDDKKTLGHDVRMADSDEDIQYKAEFTARVKSARVATGRKQWEVADLLQVPQDYYKHWESGRLMPHRYIGRFCTICRVDPSWLLTGQGPKALKEPHLVATDPEPVKAKPKRQKRSRAA
jgi:DNA-binding transcriptional regulator YiaG